MSDPVSSISKGPAVSEHSMTSQDVINYLRQNPGFLHENPEVLDCLLPAPVRPKKGGVADFQSYMIERLKADKAGIMEDAREIIETSRVNMNNQQRIHMAVLHLLEARRFDDFIHTMTIDFASLLDVDIAVFLVEADSGSVPHIHMNGIRILPEGRVRSWMGEKAVLMQNDISGIEAIYGGGAALVRSQILLRIDISSDAPPAILAFGSRDPAMFDEGQATDQILFLARVIERCFRLWFSLPA